MLGLFGNAFDLCEMYSAKQLYNRIISKIADDNDEQSAQGIARMVLEYFDISWSDYAVDKEVDIDIDQLEYIEKRLLLHEPIQYILGETWFYDRKFMVNKHVLIPRPETELLCNIIIEKHKNTNQILRIADVCCGSGCIGITLKKELVKAEVTGIDISHEALATAKKNAQNLNADVHFIEMDVLSSSQDAFSTYDIVVSNPPYVTESEKSMMQRNVLDYEPHLALFVDNHDPLIFYKNIVSRCAFGVREIYVEINEAYSEQVVRLLYDNNFKQATVHTDMQGRPRIVQALKS